MNDVDICVCGKSREHIVELDGRKFAVDQQQTIWFRKELAGWDVVARLKNHIQAE